MEKILSIVLLILVFGFSLNASKTTKTSAGHSTYKYDQDDYYNGFGQTSGSIKLVAHGYVDWKNPSVYTHWRESWAWWPNWINETGRGAYYWYGSNGAVWATAFIDYHASSGIKTQWFEIAPAGWNRRLKVNF